MKKQKWLVAAIAATTTVFSFLSCTAAADPQTEPVITYVDKKADEIAPSPVTNFTALGQKNAVKLTWTEPTEENDIYGYEISYNVFNDRVILPVLDTANIIVAPGSSGYIISSLTSGIEYTFSIKTVDTSGNKSQAETAKATPTDVDDATVPAPVSNLAAFGLLTSVKLTWDEVEDISNIYGYEISYDVSAIGRAALSTLDSKSMIVAPGTGVAAGKGECTIHSLVSGVEYTFTVKTISTNGIKSEAMTINATPSTAEDTTPPAPVTNFRAASKDRAVLLSWDAAIDNDNLGVYGYEISYDETSKIEAGTLITPNAKKIIVLDNGELNISGLKNGTEYLFVIKTIDPSGNMSEAVSAKVKPEDPDGETLSITLSADEVPTNTSLTVTASIATPNTISKVLYKKNGSINPRTLLADPDAIAMTQDATDPTKFTFTLSPDPQNTNESNENALNGTYTVAALDRTGRMDAVQITINNFDFTAPADVTNIATDFTRNNDPATILLSWTNPEAADFDHVIISYVSTDYENNTSESSDLITPVKEEGAEEYPTTYLIENIDTSKSNYIFTIQTVDKLGNKSLSTSKKCYLRPEGFVIAEGATFEGTDAVPNSYIFISNRRLTIKDLYVSDHETTQEEYEKYMTYYGTVYNNNTKPSDNIGKGPNYPVYYINWYEMIIYCNLRSIDEGLTPAYYLLIDNNKVTDIAEWAKQSNSYIFRDINDKYFVNSTEQNSVLNGVKFDETANGYRLPTDVEWEYLARDGNLTNDSTQLTYSGSNTIGDVAWYTDNSTVNGTKKTHIGKTKNATNRFKLYDMSGNVYEACWDYNGSINAQTPATGAAANTNYIHIVRGGAYNAGANGCTVQYRTTAYPYARSVNTGFRVVRTVK